MLRCVVIVMVTLSGLTGCSLTTKPVSGPPAVDGDADADADTDADGDTDADADADGDADGDVCVPTGTPHVCAGGGAARCCSLQCTGDECTSAEICRVIGDGCDGDPACCSRSCGPGGRCVDPLAACLPRGEMCGSDGDCCGRYCHGNPLHCSAPADEPCGARGEICQTNGDCCSDLCSQGHCTSQGECLAADEPCVVSADCCSQVCQDRAGPGPSRCAP